MNAMSCALSSMRPVRSHAERLAALACLGTLAVGTACGGPGTVPTSFSDSVVVAGLRFPCGMTSLPDGRVLLTEQFTARIRLIVNGALSSTDPVCTVPDVQNQPFTERGLLGIAVDPGWPARPYVYVYYDAVSTTTIHIARFAASGDLGFVGDGALAIDPSTRRDVLATIPDSSTDHNGGTLRFGPDGMLYASLGDDDHPCGSQDSTALLGKILRLDVRALPDGAGGPPAQSAITPADNPFVSSPNANERLLWALGLRNPFRFAIDADGTLLAADVGAGAWEEIDRLPGGGLDLGWPLYEGPAPGSACTNVSDTGLTGPIYDYPHGTGAYAVIGGPVYRPPACAAGGTSFPASYVGDYFFGDYYRGFLRRLKGSGSTWSLANPEPGQPDSTDWGTGYEAVSDWMVGCDAALWYCRQALAFADSTGEIRRIVYHGAAGMPPDEAAAEFLPPWPSPARGFVSLAFRLPRRAVVSLELFGARGDRVRRLLRSRIEGPGERALLWDGLDDEGRRAPAGLYLARLRVEGRDLVRRIPLIR